MPKYYGDLNEFPAENRSESQELSQSKNYLIVALVMICLLLGYIVGRATSITCDDMNNTTDKFIIP